MDNRRWYRNAVGGIKLSEQAEIATAQGMTDRAAIYEDTAKTFPRQRTKALESTRATGDHIWVSDFVVFVPKKKFLRAALALLKQHKVYVYEGRTGRRTDKPADYALILHDAIDYWGKGRLPHHLAVEYGRKGGKQFARNRRKLDKRMPKAEAMRYWRNAEYRTWHDALDAINAHDGYEHEWTRSAAYRELKNRQLPSGPRTW